jgi:hypothetical protein
VLFEPSAKIFRLDRPNEHVSPDPPLTRALSPTLPAKLLTEVTVMFDVAVTPAMTVAVAGLAETAKLARGIVTLNVTVTR